MTDVNIIKAIGDEIGYGHLMSIASALWREKLKKMGVPESGAFVPILPCGIKDDWVNNYELKQYDDIIKKK